MPTNWEKSQFPGKNALASVLEEQERLLGEMGLSPEDYHITSIDWDGESFMDEEGQVCRLALAGGERRLRDYETVYSGQVQAEEPVSYEVSAIYEAARESAGEDTVPDIQEETGENERPSPLPDRYSRLGSDRCGDHDCSRFFRPEFWGIFSPGHVQEKEKKRKGGGVLK